MGFRSSTSPILQEAIPHDEAVTRVAKFIRQEGEVVYDLLELLLEEVGAEAADELIELCEQGTPDRDLVQRKIEEIFHALSDVPFSLLDQFARNDDAPCDVHSMVRWYGAQFSELADRLRQV